MNSSSDIFLASSRQSMVDSQLRARGVRDERVLAAMARVPRHQFAPERYRDQAYEDHPLPIVAIMLVALALRPSDRVLEVGTGSGYVTALLAEIVTQVFSVERHAALADAARDLLACLGYMNAKVIVGDGSQGFAEAAPYDAIIVSAAAPEVPPALLAQLAEGGRMMLPVGTADSQQLQLIRMENGQPRVALRELCRFVPLVSGTQSRVQ
jgi:protein-L-isoaspartate(D-aspartate) O-methyltransferase